MFKLLQIIPQTYSYKINNQNSLFIKINKSTFKDNFYSETVENKIASIFSNYNNYSALNDALLDLQSQVSICRTDFIEFVADELAKQKNFVPLTEYLCDNYSEYCLICLIKNLCNHQTTIQNIDFIVKNNLNIMADQSNPKLKTIIDSDSNINKLSQLMKILVKNYPFPLTNLFATEFDDNELQMIMKCYPITKRILEKIRSTFCNVTGTFNFQEP